MSMSNTYNISEVASKLGISTKTLRRWEDAGRFKGGRTEGNQRRYTLGDIHILDAIKSGLVNSHKELLTKEQVISEYGLDQITLDDWENKGQIHPLVTAGGIFYPQKALIDKLKSHLAKVKPAQIVSHMTTPQPQSSVPSYPSPTTSTAPTTLTAPTYFSHHDFWVLFLLNLLVTLTLILLYHILTSV